MLASARLTGTQPGGGQANLPRPSAPGQPAALAHQGEEGMNIFYRDFRADSPVTTGAQWLAALTARVAVALVHALPYGRLTSGQTWVLALVLAAWMGTSVFPVTAGLATVVNAVLVGVEALRLLGRVKEIGSSLAAGLRAAYAANTEAELAAAGALLGRALDEYALNALSGLPLRDQLAQRSELGATDLPGRLRCFFPQPGRCRNRTQRRR